MADALADVMKDQNEKAKIRQAGPSKKRKTSPATWMAFFILSALSAYVWFGSPPWLAPSPPSLSPALADAGLRMEVFQQALLIEAFREVEGRLPSDLAEAGNALTEVEYDRIDALNYRLGLAGQTGAVEYVSTESLDAFLGNSLQVVRQGG